jgi:hypothetical protein
VDFLDTNARSAMRLYQARVGTQATTILQGNAATGNGTDVREAKPAAQSFLHGSTNDPQYSISKLVVNLSRTATVPDAPMYISIGTNLNGGTVPGSMFVINPTAITDASGGSTYQRYELLYTQPVLLNAGTTYYINFNCEALNGARIYIETSQTGAAYPNGTFYRDGSSQGRDAVFEIWGQ